MVTNTNSMPTNADSMPMNTNSMLMTYCRGIIKRYQYANDIYVVVVFRYLNANVITGNDENQ